MADQSCAKALTEGLTSVLTGQGEKPDVAKHLAEDAVWILSSSNLGPRPFLIASPSGTDFSFFFELKHSECLLRLYGRQKGFTSYTNNLTYIATQPLLACTCSE